MKLGLIITNALLLLYIISVLCVAKECTNTPSQLSSHTFRNALLQSKNESLKTEMFSHYHLTPTDDTAWSSLLPRKMLREEEDEYGWTMMYRKIRTRLTPLVTSSRKFHCTTLGWTKTPSTGELSRQTSSIY